MWQQHRTRPLAALCLFLTCVIATTELGSNQPIADVISDQQQQLINDRDENSIEPQGDGETQQERIEAIKLDILAKLGLSRAPDVSGMNVTAAEKRHLLRMYRRSLEEMHGKTHVLFDEGQQQAKNFYSFTATPHGERNGNNEGGQRNAANSVTSHRLYFNLDIPEPDDPRKETVVTSATLKVYKYATASANNGTVDDSLDDILTITVCQILEEISGNEVRPACRLIYTRVVATRDSGWIDFNVAEMVSDWIRDPATNFGLKVTIVRPSQSASVDDRGFIFRGESSSQHLLLNGQQAAQPEHRVRHSHEHLPLLNVIAQERLIVPSNQRMRRSVPDEGRDCTRGDGETRCCRYSIWISFADIGWAGPNGWVIAPDGYRAYYCAGRCPLRHRVAHHYSHIRWYVNQIYPNRVPGPVCSATKLSPLSLAHYIDGRQVVSVFDNMIVQTCQCT